MLTRLMYVASAWLLLSVFVTDRCQADRPRLPKPSEKKFEIRKTKHLIGLRVSGGKLLGDAASEISNRRGGFYEQLLFGLGLMSDYAVTGSFAVGLSADYGWKTPPTEWVGVISYRSFAGSLTYRLSPDSRSSLCVRSEVGVMAFHSGGYGLGSHTHIRLSVGEVRATGSTTAVRWEIYYRHVFAKGHDISTVPLMPWDEAPFDVAWIGLDLTFAFGF